MTLFGARITCFGAKITLFGAKVTCFGAKETYLGATELFLGAKETYLGATELFLGAKETYLGARITFLVPQKTGFLPRFDSVSGAKQEAFSGGLGAAEGCFSNRRLRYEPQTMKRYKKSLKSLS
ncbi:MAG: hypothetical protein LBD13_03860 [Spirochaetaceae bacterium]|jgi:hypothetical protein|nr:hypothetical protein [Spirochaetaceae bacterium]